MQYNKYSAVSGNGPKKKMQYNKYSAVSGNGPKKKMQYNQSVFFG